MAFSDMGAQTYKSRSQETFVYFPVVEKNANGHDTRTFRKDVRCVGEVAIGRGVRGNER
jgi:hypothetical protein